MSIDFDVLDTMAAAGATAAQIIAVVRTMDAPAARKRKADAERLRRKRGDVARHDATERVADKERKVSTPSKERNTTPRDAPANPAKSCTITTEAFELAEAIGAEAGYAAPIDWPTGWCGAAWQIQRFLNEGYTATLIRMACTAVMRRGRGPPEYFAYFEKPIIDMRSRLEAPLPQVKPHQLEVIDGGRSDARTGFGGRRGRIVGGRAVSRHYGSAVDAIDVIREEFAREAERRGEEPYIPSGLDS